MNEFPIVTLSALFVFYFLKMSIKVRIKTPLSTFCAITVIPLLVIAQVPARGQELENNKEATPAPEISKDTPKQTAAKPTNQPSTRLETHKPSEHSDHKKDQSKPHQTEHSSQNKHPANATSKSNSHSVAENKSVHINSSSGVSDLNNVSPSTGNNANKDETKSKTPSPLTSAPAPAPAPASVQSSDRTSNNTLSSTTAPKLEATSNPLGASTGSSVSQDQSNLSAPNQNQPNTGGAGKTTPAKQNPAAISGAYPTELNNSGNTGNAGSASGPSSPSTAPSMIGSFIDSVLNFQIPNSKSSSTNGRFDPTNSGPGTINLGPLPEPVPPPLYLNASKHSTPLSTPYSLSTGERNTTGDNAILDMAQAFKRGDRKRLSATLPYALGHPLEPWAAYWELRARLDEASYSEVREFLKRYAGTYQEDRMRNDWLLMAGSRREWDTLLDEYPYFRMRDDRELQCYYLMAQFVQLGPKAQPDTNELVLQNWHALRDADDGCMLAVDRLHDAHKISELDIWRKVRVATEYNQSRLAKNALKIIEPKYLPDLEDIFKNPSRFLSQPINAPTRPRDELITVALIRLSASDPGEAVRQLLTRWISYLNAEQRTWVWAIAGREAALKGDPKSLEYFDHASVDKDIGNDELLAWKVRVELRVDTRPRWEAVDAAIAAMSSNAQREPAWAYWRARALLQKKPQTQQITQEAQSLLNSVAGVKGFYEQLALEELGKKITTTPRPEPLKPQEINSIKANPALRRAIYAINLGLRSEGNREWNYATNLVDNAGKIGGMSDRDLLAAATYACDLEIWDRCVNAAERSKVIDATLRFPMPFKEMVLKRTKEIAIDPAYVYGLIRQESRFVMDAKSSVGASGLMQIMPKTAAWTAKKIGLLNFKPELLASREVNIAIGTGYLKLVLDSFDGSMPMAAAAYNAGPSRVRHWQEGSIVEGAIWAESLPFNETRDYVKKVLANTVNYQALITSEPQSLKARLGTIGPMDAAKALLENSDLP